MAPATCPECRHELIVPERYAGKRWRCPDCRTAFVPPAPAGNGASAPRGRIAAAFAALLNLLRN